MNKLLELFKNKNNENIIKPYFIAEAGVNHEGSIEIAKKLIHLAKEGGADAIKFQTYKANLIASKNSPSYWDLSKESTKSQFQLFKKYDKFWKKEFEVLKNECDKVGIEFMSTPFDLESANFLNDLQNVFKISSSDLTNKPFIEHICKFKKPIILSTGASNEDEIKNSVNWINKYNNPLALLHCVLSYPTSNLNANLGQILGLKTMFSDKIIGYSDHTLPGNYEVLNLAVALGSKIIEKHFTHDKTLKGNDHYHAFDKEDLLNYNKMVDNSLLIIGDRSVVSLDCEKKAILNARRSLVASRNIKKNKCIVKEDLTWKRPGHGVSPKDIEKIIGRKANVDINSDDIIHWNFFD